jgi:hypothetical protein
MGQPPTHEAERQVMKMHYDEKADLKQLKYEVA